MGEERGSLYSGIIKGLGISHTDSKEKKRGKGGKEGIYAKE